jgi:hypothetical protein
LGLRLDVTDRRDFGKVETEPLGAATVLGKVFPRQAKELVNDKTFDALQFSPRFEEA